MRQQALAIRKFETRIEAGAATAEIFAEALAQDAEEIGRASFFSSGGSSPKEMLEQLSEHDIDWSRLDVGLVDERCVPQSHEASNAALVKRHLIQNKAAVANFYPMFREEVHPDDLASEASATYEQVMPPSALLLGMGADTHTASWFPGSADLDLAYDETEQAVVKIDARGCPGAGEITDRLTLTRASVAASKCAVLLMFGNEKMQKFTAAMSEPLDKAPIRAAVEDLGDRLITVWAP